MRRGNSSTVSVMRAAQPQHDRLESMPLWRLLVLLEDVEREQGASCSTARVIARIISERLKSERNELPPRDRRGVGNG